ncbi:MAG: hypothetical protein FJ121_06900 [Deltaproteobacteria bacterium]|nr:hypothetical protein [Deltaproteobacteria bacterium]
MRIFLVPRLLGLLGNPFTAKLLFRFGGTGFQPVRRTGKMPVPPKAAGTEACPTNLFMLYG